MALRSIAVFSAACGVVAVIAVFLPWYSSSVEGMETPSGMEGFEIPTSGTANGTRSPFLGVWVLVLSLLGIVASGLVATGREDLVPLSSLQVLFVAALLFGLAAILCVVDVFRDVGGGSMTMGDVKFSAGKSFGLFLTLLATLAAACISGGGSIRGGAR